MSRNSLSSLIANARAASVELLIAAEQPYKDVLAAARQKVSEAEQVLQQAKARTAGADAALGLVKQARSMADDSAVAEAVTAAEAECTAAHSARAGANWHLCQASAALVVALSPVQAYLDLVSALDVLAGLPDGDLENAASTVSRLAAAVVAHAKSQHPIIAEAEAEVRRTAAVCGEASSSSREADRANRAMQRAFSLSATEPNRLAAEATKQRWEAATSVEAAASEASSAAHVAHESALQLVKGQLELLKTATSLAQEANRIDAGVRQTAAAEAAYEARDTRYEYDADQCTCSETSEVSCNYCRGLQERRSNEWRDNDPCR